MPPYLLSVVCQTGYDSNTGKEERPAAALMSHITILHLVTRIFHVPHVHDSMLGPRLD